METKFKAVTSSRVTGLSFHPTNPWIIVTLDSGVIELWDYRQDKMIQSFAGHKGPVRGINSNESKPIFVSGGDDSQIMVWNYQSQRHLFSLTGHYGSIRTVQFHHELPWIVSASDDMSIRIWNWRSKKCLSVLTRHKNRVMCASFHRRDNLLLSASLDQTLFVWDIGRLRNKYIKAGLPSGDVVILKYKLQGHAGGVNWASFHPTLPLVVSGADDRQVKLWRMNDNEACEEDTLRGHRENVSSVMFHENQNIIVSSSGNSISVWDVTKRTRLQTFRVEHDRFCTLAVHPHRNLLAAGLDNGLVLFKLGRDRPAFALSGDSLFYTKAGFLRHYDISTRRDSQVIPIGHPGTARFNQSPRTLSYSRKENAMLICSDLDGGSYELHIIPKDSIVHEAKRGTGDCAVFVSQDQFAVLKRNNQVLVMNLENKVVKHITLPISTDAIFSAGTANLLCISNHNVTAFDLWKSLVLGDLQARLVKNVVWSKDEESVALLSKNTITLATKNLANKCTIYETGVKSGAWDDNGVFIYTTLTHLKYCRPDGHSGVIRLLDIPLYLTTVNSGTGTMLCFTEELEVIEEAQDGQLWEFGKMDLGMFEEFDGFVEEVEGIDGDGTVDANLEDDNRLIERQNERDNYADSDVLDSLLRQR